MFTTVWLKDTVERCLAVFLFTAVGALAVSVAAQQTVTLDALAAAAAGGLAAALSLLKSLIGALVASDVSPASWWPMSKVKALGPPIGPPHAGPKHDPQTGRFVE